MLVRISLEIVHPAKTTRGQNYIDASLNRFPVENALYGFSFTQNPSPSAMEGGFYFFPLNIA